MNPSEHIVRSDTMKIARDLKKRKRKKRERVKRQKLKDYIDEVSLKKFDEKPKFL